MYNTLKTTVLLAALTALIILIGRYFGGQQGMIIAFVLAMVMNFSSYWFSDKIVLSMYRAQPLSRNQAPQLFSIVERLSQQAGLPMPKIYILPHDAPKCFRYW